MESGTLAPTRGDHATVEGKNSLVARSAAKQIRVSERVTDRVAFIPAAYLISKTLHHSFLQPFV